MTAETCLFCNRFESKTESESICGNCVQLLLKADQSELKRAHEKAIEKQYWDKASAIESFLIPEGFDEQRKPASKKRGRHSNRKRIVRTVGDKEKRIGRSKVPAQAPLL